MLAAGLSLTEWRARRILLFLATHDHASVRLAAVYGLSKHVEDDEVLCTLRRLAVVDVDAEIRLAAALVLNVS